MYKCAAIWGGSNSDYIGFVYPVWGEGNACQEEGSVSASGGGQACIDGHQFGVEEKSELCTSLG